MKSTLLLSFMLVFMLSAAVFAEDTTTVATSTVAATTVATTTVATTTVATTTVATTTVAATTVATTTVATTTVTESTTTLMPTTFTSTISQCQAGSTCTIDVCTFGTYDSQCQCTGGYQKSCDDNDQCTLDSCDRNKGCVHVPSGASGCATTTTSSIGGCPTVMPPVCGAGESMRKEIGADGCARYWCEKRPCPTPPALMQCAAGENIRENRDYNGCIVGYYCESVQAGGECKSYQKADGSWVNCWIEFGNCKCQGETVPRPPQPPQPPQVICPDSDKCPDGKQIKCWREGEQCRCEGCGIPQNCVEMKDPNTGFVHTVCGGVGGGGGTTQPTCPYTISDSERSDRKKRCEETGGTTTSLTDERGCEKISCSYPSQRPGGECNMFQGQGYSQCPSDEEIRQTYDKCEKNGMRVNIVEECGCKIAKCIEEFKDEKCKHIPEPERMEKEKACYEKGGYVAMDFDERGCQIVNCFDAGEDKCLRLPEEAFERCKNDGGELVVKDDSRGCVTWQECVKRGDKDNVYYDPIEDVPDMTVLMDIAFKLEGLKMELDALAVKTRDIANYYKSSGNKESERFVRVSKMFESAMQDVNALKNKLAGMLDNPEKQALENIRNSIRELRDVKLKDILYVMLSSDPEVSVDITTNTEGDCGSDGRCFDDAVRICKPIKFTPDQDVVVTITGLDGDKCNIHVELREGRGPPGMDNVYMDCPLPNFANGMRGPDDLLPYCKGSMKEMMEKYGISPTQQASQPARGGGGSMGAEQQCISDCVGDNIICSPGEGGEQNPQCRVCADKCTKSYEGPCMDDMQVKQKESQCQSKCEHCYGDIKRGSSGEGYDCIVAVECKDASGEFGDQPLPMQPVQQLQPVQTTQTQVRSTSESCVGCLNNGVCDPGECSGCPDCRGK